MEVKTNLHYMTTPKESGWREEMTGKIVNLLATQKWITDQGERYIGDKDVTLNAILRLMAQVETTAIAATEARVVEMCEEKAINSVVNGKVVRLEDIRALFSSKT